MLSSLFPRSSIYKSLDEDRHSHAFDAGNTALFNADELDEEEDEDAHASGHAPRQGNLTGVQRGHRYQPSLPDPFEHMPKTGTIPANLPLITSAPTSPNSIRSPATHDDRGTTLAGEDMAAGTSYVDPFQAHHDYSDDPMAAMSQRLNSPYGVKEHDVSRAGREVPNQAVRQHSEAEPPTSM